MLKTTYPISGDTENDNGIARGINIPIVPYAVPVANDIIAPSINIIAGNKNFGIELERSLTKNAAVPSSFITELNDHASIKITPVIISPFIPSTQTSTASVNVNIFLNTPIAIATMDANNADWNNATDASDALNASLIAVNDAGELVINA